MPARWVRPGTFGPRNASLGGIPALMSELLPPHVRWRAPAGVMPAPPDGVRSGVARAADWTLGRFAVHWAPKTRGGYAHGGPRHRLLERRV